MPEYWPSSSKPASMRPLLANLLVLLATILITTFIYANVGPGMWREATTSLFSVPLTIQFLALALSANARRPPPPHVSKLTLALWAGAAYPFMALMSPLLVFPTWFVVASAPVGFVTWYAMLSVMLWMLSRLPRWRFPWARNP